MHRSWQKRSNPLPHCVLRDGQADPVCIVLTVGDGPPRPNLGYGEGGAAASAEDRRQLAAAMGISPESMVFMEQVHGPQAAVVDQYTAGAGLESRSAAVGGVDALVTADRTVGLVGLSADCPLVALWDDGPGIAAMVHAGWRSLAAGILARTTMLMRAMGASSTRLRAAVGPSIGPCCYEVNSDVPEAMKRSGVAADKHLRRGDRRTTLDLRGLILSRLAEFGIEARRMVIHPECTMCRADLFHSHRRDGPSAGRQAMAIRLKG